MAEGGAPRQKVTDSTGDRSWSWDDNSPDVIISGATPVKDVSGTADPAGPSGRSGHPLTPVGSGGVMLTPISTSVSPITTHSERSADAEYFDEYPSADIFVKYREKLQNVWSTHQELFYQDRLDKYPYADPRSAEVAEFMNYYLRSYVEPCGWIGRVVNYEWEANCFPVPYDVGSWVQVTNFNPKHMALNIIMLKDDEEEQGRLDADDPKYSKEIHTICVWDVLPVRPLPNVVLNFQTFRDALELFRIFKTEWCLPYHSGISAESWFSEYIHESQTALVDLCSPEKVGEVYEEMVALWCSTRRFEDARGTLELKLLLVINDDDEIEPEEADEATINKLTYTNSQIERLKPELQQLLSRTCRWMMASQEKQIDSIREDDYVVVIEQDQKINFEILDNMRNYVAADMTRRNLPTNISIEFQVIDDLKVALRSCKAGATILLGPGNYKIASLGMLESGGKIVGFPTGESKTIISCRGAGNVWLLVGDTGENQEEERKAELTIENVSMTIPAQASLVTAIIVKSRAILTLRHCEMKNESCVESDDYKNAIIAVEEIGDGKCIMINTVCEGFFGDEVKKPPQA